MFNPIDLLQHANRNFILGDTTQEEQLSFIQEQIRDPFNSGDINYLKRLAEIVPGQDELDEILKDLFVRIQDVYPHLRIDVSDYDQRLLPLFRVIYKFFVKNAPKIMYLYIWETISNNKARKVLTDEFSSMKLPNYPKEQYGKREFYILITKLDQIVDEIFDDDIKLKRFIETIDRSDRSPVWVSVIQDALRDGYVVDNGVIGDMYKRYKRCDGFRSDMNRLETEITRNLIIPYMKENHILSVRIPPSEEIPDELEDDEEDDNE